MFVLLAAFVLWLSYKKRLGLYIDLAVTPSTPPTQTASTQ